MKRQPDNGEDSSSVQINYFSQVNPQFEDSKHVYDRLECESPPYEKIPVPGVSLSDLDAK